LDGVDVASNKIVAGGGGSDTINITDTDISYVYGSDVTGLPTGGDGEDQFNISGDSSITKIWVGYAGSMNTGTEEINISDTSTVGRWKSIQQPRQRM